MIRSRLFSHDPETNTTKIWHYDDEKDEAWIETKWDLNAIGQENAEIRKEDTGRFNDGLHRIGQIPMALYWKLKTQGVLDDKRLFRRWWQSDEAEPFKTKSCWV